MWYTKHDASNKIGVSTKTIEQFAKAGKIQQVMYKRPSGGPKVAVYEPADVDRLAAERKAESEPPPPPFVMPAGANGNGARASARSLARVATTNGDAAAILHALMTAAQKGSQSSEKLFLTIPEAAQISGLSEAYIRRACKTEKLAAIKDGGWKIKRAALVAL
jgi:hypothetical protein